MRAQIYWVAGDTKLAIFPRPRSGDWLEDELADYRKAGLDVLISLLEPEEAKELGLEEERQAAQTAGLRFINFPIPDRCTPKIDDWTVSFIKDAHRALAEGKRVGIHCRMGIGRSAMIAATLLALDGVEPDEAWAQLETARGQKVPDTPEQRAWVEEALLVLKKR